MASEKTISGTITGTTTATNTAVVSIDTRGTALGKAVIIINNTGGTNTMYYQINGYPADMSGGTGNGGTTATAGQYQAFKAQTSIATSTAVTSTSDVTNPVACLQILVQNNSGATTYQIDYIAY